jgi:hypothetical protein
VIEGSIAHQLIARWVDAKTGEPQTVPLPTATKADYVTVLGNGVWVVEFTKVDGTPSVMEVTLDPTIVPPTPVKEGKAPREEKDHLIHAYSPDRGGWRSFTIANIKKFYRK